MLLWFSHKAMTGERGKLSMKSKSSVPSSGRPTTLLSRIVRRLIIWVYVWKGWQIEGNLPKDIKKFIIAGAPHTSNWDFVFFTGATHEQGVLPNFMGKHTLFRGIMRDFMFDGGYTYQQNNPGKLCGTSR